MTTHIDSSWNRNAFVNDAISIVSYTMPRLSVWHQRVLRAGKTTMPGDADWLDEYHGEMRRTLMRTRDELIHVLHTKPEDEWSLVELAAMKYVLAAGETIVYYGDEAKILAFLDAADGMRQALTLSSEGIPDTLAELLGGDAQ